MTQHTGKPVSKRPVPAERLEVGHAVDGRRWNGSRWEPAGAEGIASVPAPRRHQEDIPVASPPAAEHLDPAE